MLDLAGTEVLMHNYKTLCRRGTRHPAIAPGGRRQPIDRGVWNTPTIAQPLLPAGRSRPALWIRLRRCTAFTLVRVGARLLGVQNDTCHGTGRIVRQSATDSTFDGDDHPIRIGLGPDRAIYITYPAGRPGTSERQGTLLRIDLSPTR